MARILGIDSGERRIGLAISDETELVARPLLVIQRREDALRQALDQIRDVAAREGAERLVVGLPLNADGSEGHQAKRARALARLLEKVVERPVEFWDERLSSVEAERMLREQGRSPRRVREAGGIDAYAAAVILQDYLDAQARERSRGSLL